MREEIIKHSIIGLQRNGLRFSIDEVAKRLKISKKTIYKYFATKEALAVEIYKTYYNEAVHAIADINDLKTKEATVQMLSVYYRSHCMVRNEIFNKYSLNASICELARTSHNKLKRFIENMLPERNRVALMVIIDGTLQKLSDYKNEEANVIETLAELLCLSIF